MELIDLVNSCNFSFSNVLTQMINVSAQIGDYDRSLTVLLFSSYASIWSIMAFSLLGISDHVAVSVSVNFLSSSKRDALFHHIVYDYSVADWEGLCDQLRDFPWQDVFNHSASVAASKFCEWMQFEIDVYLSSKISGHVSLISMIILSMVSCLCCCDSS